jgi:hypothetical protein
MIDMGIVRERTKGTRLRKRSTVSPSGTFLFKTKDKSRKTLLVRKSKVNMETHKTKGGSVSWRT